MSSVLRKMVSDVRRHKLQTPIVSFVVFPGGRGDETGLGVGYTLSRASNSVFPSLRVVGIAVSMGDEAAAWVEPGQLPTASGATAPPSEYLMAYRLHNASTPAEIASAVNTTPPTRRPHALTPTSNPPHPPPTPPPPPPPH